jgi:hypothetical protein
MGDFLSGTTSAPVTKGSRMTSGSNEGLGRLDDEAEAAETSSTTDGPAAEGEFDPAQGSPGTGHPVGEGFPSEAVRHDEPELRPRTSTQESSED